ncbi:MAG: biopolymer transporter ExbD, partial [Oscillospiraceae bacterium]|nr:biopolymer transporter ExbD [Oscillospiraceae bacterium]
MKRGAKELLLDFTPLLDVTMILLFFFVLFSRIGVDSIRQEAAQNMQDAKALHAEASQMMQDAETLQENADGQLAILAEADARAAEAAEAMIAFSRGENYRLRLKMEPDGWVLRIYQGKKIVGALEDSKTFTEDLK